MRVKYCSKRIDMHDPELHKKQTGKDEIMPCLQCFFDRHDEWYCRDKDLMYNKFRSEE